MSLLDSEDTIAYEVEMASDITHGYLIDVMGYNWRYDETWNMDIYRRDFLGGAYVMIRRYRKTEKDQDVEPIWFALYSKLGLKEHGVLISKVRDIYAIYKEIREAYLKLGRGDF